MCCKCCNSASDLMEVLSFIKDAAYISIYAGFGRNDFVCRIGPYSFSLDKYQSSITLCVDKANSRINTFVEYDCGPLHGLWDDVSNRPDVMWRSGNSIDQDWREFKAYMKGCRCEKQHLLG